MTGTDGLALATRGLQKSYGSRTALAGLDLSVPAGVVYGFLGPNGAGKTTTMRLLTGLIHPDAGTIEVLGRPFGRGDRRRLFDVGALIETPSFYPYLSARENLRSLAATGARTSKTRIEELLELVGLRERAKDRVQTYSLGMKQRLGIAAALLSDPRLLLLDEPSNGLDPAGIVAMRTTLRQLAATGKTVFVSSHILGEVEQLVDVLGIIAAGRIVREGRIADLLEGEGTVRVRVAPAEVDAAIRVLDPIAPGSVRHVAGEAGWLSVHIPPDRSTEVNRTLAAAGIYASGLETGSDLEFAVPRVDGRRAIDQSRGLVRRPPWERRVGRQRHRWHGQRRSGEVRLFVSGLRKLVRRPVTYITLGLLVGLLALIYIAVGATARQAAAVGGDGAQALLLVTFPGAYALLLSFILGLGGLFAMIYGAAVAGSEWTWGTLKAAVARGESRSRYQLLSFASIGLMVGIGLLVAFAIGVAVAVVAANLAQVPTTGVTDATTLGTLPELLGRGWLALAEACALGFAIATLARSQLAGIGVGIALYFAEGFASIFLPDVVQYLPFSAANSVVATSDSGAFGGGGCPVALEPDVALLVVAAWLIGALVVAAVFTERAEISG